MVQMYKHILLAVDLSENVEHVIEKACAMAKAYGAQLSLVHAIERDIAADHIFVDQKDYEEKVISHAREKLQELLKNVNIPESEWHIVVDVPKSAIIKLAKQLDCDLIIVGSHGKHGLQRLFLGSTAYSVVHSAPCDVSVIRYKS